MIGYLWCYCIAAFIALVLLHCSYNDKSPFINLESCDKGPEQHWERPRLKKWKFISSQKKKKENQSWHSGSVPQFSETLLLLHPL